MSYRTPPLYTDATPATSATPGANTTATIVPAPGLAGNRLRIVAIGSGAGRSMTGIVSAVFVGAVAGTILRNGNISVGNPYTFVRLPEPGVQLGDNEPLQVQMSASVASQTFVVDVFYYIDQVS